MADDGAVRARALDHGAIRALLPQGPPMVLLDRVEWLEPGRTVHALKAISGSEPCYAHLAAGLPATRYAYPVSLLMESFGQAAAVLWLTSTATAVGAGHVLMFAAARDCRFHDRAYPGDVLRHEVRLEAAVADTGFVSGRTTAGGRLIATVGWFVAVRRPRALALPAPVHR